MTVNYEIVEHNEGWAYRMNDVYSATFVSKEAAMQAAQQVAARQEVDEVNIIDGAAEDRQDDSAEDAFPKLGRMHANGDLDERAPSSHQQLPNEHNDDKDAELDEALEETFPASDPISPSQTTRTGGPKR